MENLNVVKIKLFSFDYSLFKVSLKKIFNIGKTIAQTEGGRIPSFSVVTLPTKKKIYCILRSPHVNKDSREHFEITTYQQSIEIFGNFDSDKYRSLIKSSLPSGIISGTD